MKQYEIRGNSVWVNGEEIPVVWRGDVVVIGGGCAGVTAAAASARKKIPVLVVEQGSWFGGELSCGGGMPVWGAFPGDRSIGGMMDELLAQLRFAGADSVALVRDREKGTVYYYDNEYFKKLADELLLKSGCGRLLNTTVTDVLAAEGRVEGILVNCNFKTAAILANAFVDSTGHAAAARSLGIPFQEEDGAYEGFYPYILKHVDVERLEAYRKTDPSLKKAVVRAAADGILFDDSDRVWDFQTGIAKDSVYMNTICLRNYEEDDMGSGTEAELAAHRKLFEHIHFFRSYIPGMEACELYRCAGRVIQTAGRRIRGCRYVTAKDCVPGKTYEDGIVRCQCSDPGQGWFELPFGVMAVPMYQNLLVTGKGISVDREAGRQMGQAVRMSMGQCAGIAVAMIALHHIGSTELDGAYLRSVMEEVGCDVAGDKSRVFCEGMELGQEREETEA